jgi:hypothetical protein
MKKLLFILCILFIANEGYSQKSRGFDAHSYLKDYQTNGEIKSLNKAKENIDSASVHPSTKDDPFVQSTKGQIYLALYDNDKKEMYKVFSNITDEQKKALAIFENTPTDNLIAAFQAFQKAKELDVKKRYSEEVKALNDIAVYLDNSGRAKLNAQKYADALKAFEVAYAINNTDTTLLYLCAVSAEYAGNNAKTIFYYNLMDASSQAKPNNYISLSNAYIAEKDSLKGLEALSKGRKKFPNDINIAIVEANHYIKAKKGIEVLSGINNLIAMYPNNVNLFLIKGSICDNMAAQTKDAGKDSVKQKQYEQNIALSEASYQRVLELDPSNFFALFNLGILYYNKGVIINNKAADIIDKKKYMELSSIANIEFEKALPYLEKAYTQQPDDRNIKLVLNQIYAILKMDDKIR